MDCGKALEGPGGLGSGAAVGVAGQAPGGGLGRQTVATAGRDHHFAGTGREDKPLWQELAQEVHPDLAEALPVQGLDAAGFGSGQVEVHEHQHLVQAFPGGPQQGQHGGILAADAAHDRAVEEARMVRDQAVELRQIFH